MNYALLVGINRYQSRRIANLEGCEHDVEKVEAYLSETFGEDINVLRLTSEDATRTAIIQGFRSHLSQAKQGEFAFFYYSGHGCQEASPEAFWPYQTDKKHENIVVHDSLEGADDLADKEISLLIRELAQQGAEIVVVYDCCHAGSGTRSKEVERIRMANPRSRIRTRDQFIPGTFEQLGAKPPRHIFFSACHQTELSREKPMGMPQKWGGVFTATFLQVLRQTRQGMISYANLAEACRVSLKRRLPQGGQTPQVEALGGFSADAFFLHTDTDARKPDLYPLIADESGNWTVRLGRIHGMSGMTAARFAVYADPDMRDYRGEAVSMSIGLFESKLRLPATYRPRSKKISFVSPVFLPISKLPIWVPTNQQEEFYQAVEQLPDSQSLSESDLEKGLTRQQVLMNIALTDIHTEAPYGILLENEHYRFMYGESQSDMFVGFKVPKTTNRGHSNFLPIGRGLIHMAKWHRIKQLRNPHWRHSMISDRITLELLDQSHGEKHLGSSITLDCEQSVSFQVNLINRSPQSIHCICLYLSRYFQVEEFLRQQFAPGELPKQLDKGAFGINPQSDLNQLTERYVFLFSTQRLPFLNLSSQEKLHEVLAPHRMMPNIPDKGRFDKHQHEWFSKTLTIKLLKILGNIGPQALSVARGTIEFASHPHFRAQVGLSRSSAHMDGPLSDRILKQQLYSVGIDLVDFSSYQELETIVEIHHIQDRQCLAGIPLSLSIAVEEDEEIWVMSLPPAWDVPIEGLDLAAGERLTYAFPILGRATKGPDGRYHVALTELPANPDDGRAQSDRSCKLSFAKIPFADREYIEQTWIRQTRGTDYWVFVEEKVG